MATIAANIQQVRARISTACARAGRRVESVTLLAVSKTFAAEQVREAHASGETRFGENQVQEALAKMEELGDLRQRIEWHLIGPLQGNKTRAAAEAFDWVHSIDRLKIAERLAEQRPAHLPALNVCVQVNISGEASKSGVLPSDTAALASAVAKLPRLSLRGLMAIPEPMWALDAQRAPLRALRELQETLNGNGFALDTLSMGMSDDLEAAVLEGATIVRVGSAIFGRRAAVAGV